ncbi:MAG: BatA domain-containing protein [Thermodesulfobacteriota bacterium]
MNFSFLSPLFLIGLAAVALPVLAHLITRKTGLRKKFPAVRFLIASQGDASARSRLKDILLLLLRLLIIVLLVLVFAKPALFSYAPEGSDNPRAIAIVIDNSFSMGYGDNFKLALDKARELIDTLPDGSFGLVVPLVAGEESGLSPTSDIGTLRRNVSAVKLSNSSTDNEKRLEGAYAALENAPNHSKEVVFITDLQKNGWGNEKTGRSWLRTIDVSNEAKPPNHAVTGTSFTYGKGSAKFDLDVSNFSDKPENGLLASVNIDGEELKAFLDIPPGASVKKEFEIPEEYISADKTKEGYAEIPHDKLAVDDTRYFVISDRDESNVLVVDGDPREDARLSETYYLARAAETVSEITGSHITVKDNDAFLNEKLSGYDLIFLANVGDIKEENVRELEDFVKRGGTAVIFLGERVRPTSYNALLKKILPGELINLEVRDSRVVLRDASIFPKDVGDKIGQVMVKQHFKLVPSQDSEVILGLDGGDPFLVKKAIGKGIVFLFTSTADAGWNNFPITTVFLPVVKEFLDIPISSNEKRRNYLVGDTVSLDTASAENTIEVIDPSGKKFSPQKSPVFDKTYVPGIYTVMESGKESYKFAVNVDPRESNLEKIVMTQERPKAERGAGLVKVFRQIWRYFLWGAVLLFISEAVTRAAFS